MCGDWQHGQGGVVVPRVCEPFVQQPTKAASAGLGQLELGRREHPKYQNLSMATRTLLGLGRMFMRMVLLKPNDNSDESEKALVGNTILVAQPSPKLIAAQLPPTETEQASYFNALYASRTAESGSEILAKKKALTIDRREYLECARIRSERCPLFADIPISDDAAQEHLPEAAVP